MFAAPKTIFDVKIELDVEGKKEKTTKRVQKPENYKALAEQARAMATKAGFPGATFVVTYLDADNEPVVVEDDNDLDMAYAIAESMGQPPRIKFFLKVETKPEAAAPEEESKDEPM